MEKKSKSSCVIIGGGTLPVSCAEILLNDGWEICRVVSSDAPMKKWAAENNVAHSIPDANLSETLRRKPFDYLFSIVNQTILRADVLSLHAKLAVNYHDALLPRYAGTHATSWALLNGETFHGVTWHIITEVVDAGDVLQQQRVEIAANETALTLNTKCYEAAINSFARLAADLSNENAFAEKQFLAERTFFPRFKRPENGGVICWNNPAAKISALVRALNFGRHPNPLGAAKILVGDEFYIVRELEILDSFSETPAGTINVIETDWLQISTADREIVLRDFRQLDGSPISLSNLAAKFDLSAGEPLPELGANAARRISALNAKLCRHENFWVEKLADLQLIAAPFSSEAALPNAKNYGVAEINIPDEISSFTNDQTSPHRWQTDDLLTAAFAVLLARLGGADAFDVGYRDSEMRGETAGLENYFAAQIPLRFDVDLLQTFPAILESVKEQIETVKKHETYARDIFSRYPQLQTAIETENNFTLPVAVEKVACFEDYKSGGAARLTLVISENDATCRFVYDRDYLTTEAVEKTIAHLTTLLRAIAENPEKPAAHLSLLTAEEQRKLLFEWNDNRADYPSDSCVHQLVAARAEEFPKEIAVVCGENHLNYAELEKRSNRLARHLRKSGVGAEVLVAVLMERSIETVVGLLGILKAGGAYLPLDPTYPPERVAFMLDDAGVRVLLTQQRLKASLPPNKCRIVCLDSEWDLIAVESAAAMESGATAGSLAYVIYTSGSTGKPKGVEIEHGGLVNLVTWHQQTYDLTPQSRATLLAGPAFDASVWELWTYLATGASVHIPDEETRCSAPKLLAWLARQKITHCFLPTPLAEAFLELEMPPDFALRFLLTGGDRLHRTRRQTLPFQIFNHYGPTENTVVATFGEVEADLENKNAPSIGRPIANTKVFLLDRHRQPVPIGIPGEIYIGGAGVARGYRHRPDLTAERFITHSFDDKLSLRLYKTGDSARYLPDGEIDFLERLDGQVKIRGFRIELGEIENRLVNHPSIKEAIVIAVENRAGEKRLVAYVVPKENKQLKTGELREYLKKNLPDYMCPAIFVELVELPLTPNGKIDRRALPAQAAVAPDAEGNFVAHRSDLESRLVVIWETILQIQPVGVRDDFFELGGHSLQAVRMFAEVEKTFNVNIPLATLFQAGTIEKLAEILHQDGWAEPESSLVPIQPHGAKPKFFCVHAKGGNVLFYRDLAKHLGADQPFYGIQARRLGGRQVGHAVMEEMAEFYIKEIQTVQPAGPYFLGGSSFGGLAAFEMARQLRAQGHAVAMVALLDTGTPDYPKLLPETTKLRAKFYSLTRRFQHHGGNLKTLNARGKAGYALEKLAKVKLKYRRRIRDNYKKIVRKLYAAFKGKGAVPKSYIQLEDQIWRAGQKYVPQIYAGKVTLFRAALQPLGIVPDATLGWKNLVGGELEIHEVPGHHGSIVAEPYVAALAEKLKFCIEKTVSEGKLFADQSPPVASHRRKSVRLENVSTVT